MSGEQLGSRELVAGLVVVASVALILLARSPALPRVVRLRAKPALP